MKMTLTITINLATPILLDLRTWSICDPESPPNLSLVQPRKIHVQRITSIFKGFCKIGIVYFVIVDFADDDGQVIMTI